MENVSAKAYCGQVAIIGRPNVGKSTLLNTLVQEKVSITADKPQTTRYKIIGIRNIDNCQYIFLDTPGLQLNPSNAMNRILNKTVWGALQQADLVVQVTEAMRFQDVDEWIYEECIKLNLPLIILFNKTDKLENLSILADWHTDFVKNHPANEYVPICAKRPSDVNRLFSIIQPYLKVNKWLYPRGEITTYNEEFFVREIIREKIFRLLGQELPYTTLVQIKSFKRRPEQYSKVHNIWIEADLVVPRLSHKLILLGSAGSKLQKIGTQARLELESHLHSKVILKLWVKVAGVKDWQDSWQANHSVEKVL